MFIYLSNNNITGGLEPLQGCTALLELYMSYNQLNGNLDPLKASNVSAEL